MSSWLKALALFAVGFLFLTSQPALVQGGGLFALAILLWTTGLIAPMPAAVLIPLLGLALKLISPEQLAGFLFSPIMAIFLFGFAFTHLCSVQKLDQVALYWIRRIAGRREWLAVLGLFASTAMLSMWSSTAAITTLMLPLGMALARGGEHSLNKERFVLVGVVYSATIGGMTTLAGSSVNLIAAGLTGLSFADWMLQTFPIAVVLWWLSLAGVWLLYRPRFGALCRDENQALDLSASQRRALVIFVVVVLSWIIGGFVLPREKLLWVPLGAVALMLATGLVRVQGVVRSVRWHVVMLFVSALTLGKVLTDTGAGLAGLELVMAWMQGWPGWAKVACFILVILVVTEFMSNAACATVVAPVMGAALVPLGLEPAQAALIMGMACASAFVLPSATPANAILFATTAVQYRDMLRTGIWVKAMVMLILMASLFLF